MKDPNPNNPPGYNDYRGIKYCPCDCHEDGDFHVCMICHCEELCDNPPKLDGKKTRVGIEYIVYNEEQFLKSVLLTTASRLRGVDFMFILDGAWKGTGGEAHSTDKTKEIVEECAIKIKERYKIDVKFGSIDAEWRTQGEKRNFGLRRAEEIMQKIDTECNWYHMILDGDEFIRFHSGLEEMWLDKQGAGLDQIWPKIGLVGAFAARSSKELWTPRFIPAFQNYHYHTDQRMVIHDKNCVPIIDYNPAKRSYAEKLTTKIHQFFLLNKWNVRDISRGMMKMTYNAQTYPNVPAKCLFNSLNT